ncbi:hypothetical protein [Pseudonocardia sp.]|uniref:hypothetical protein n=1 Tax=Pseudonocardia sp. TaxID=60912 RepID=UPI002605F406|nr:hypothetical protein [Pseudonocardia sp.]
MTIPPTVREIAELTARLRELSARGREVDPDQRAAFLADKHALLNRIRPAPHETASSPMSAEEAARRLTGPGRSLDESRALVRDYLDDTSDRVGVPAHLWGLDEYDLTAIESSGRGADEMPPVVVRCPEDRPRADAQYLDDRRADEDSAGDDLTRGIER